MADATPAGERLAERLRSARRSAELSGVRLAGLLGPGWNPPRVSKIEHARQIPAEEAVRRWAAVTGADADELLDLRQRARAEEILFRRLSAEPGSVGSAAPGPVGAAERLAVTEAGCARVAIYSPVVVPGPLQTPAYAWEIVRRSATTRRRPNEGEIGRLVAAALRRRAILYRPGAEVVLVMGEGALRSRYGSRPVQHEQLLHLAEIAESVTAATVAVVPFGVTLPVVALNGWAVRDDVVTVEHSGGAAHVADPEVVAAYAARTADLLAVARSGARAADLARALARELDREGAVGAG